LFYLVTTTLRQVDHLSFDEAKKLALQGRGEGKRTELVTEDQATRRGLLDNMQDLTQINNWRDVARSTK
jgi:hypothetical protein